MTQPPAVAAQPRPLVTNSSLAANKIALFRRLFGGGRTDAFPARWDNPKTGRSGYALACAKEWVRGELETTHRKTSAALDFARQITATMRLVDTYLLTTVGFGAEHGQRNTLPGRQWGQVVDIIDERQL